VIQTPLKQRASLFLFDQDMFRLPQPVQEHTTILTIFNDISSQTNFQSTEWENLRRPAKEISQSDKLNVL